MELSQAILTLRSPDNANNLIMDLFGLYYFSTSQITTVYPSIFGSKLSNPIPFCG